MSCYKEIFEENQRSIEKNIAEMRRINNESKERIAELKKSLLNIMDEEIVLKIVYQKE